MNLKKLTTNGIPRIDRIQPEAGIPGGDITILGSGFVPRPNTRPRVRFGETDATLLLSAETHLIARVPDGAVGGIVRVETSRAESQPFAFHLGVQIADNLHPVTNPAVDVEGNIYVTYSGQRGQKVPVSLYKITPNYAVKPFVTELMNPTGLALDREGYLYVSCRNDGTIHRVSPDGRSQLWIEGMGTATGIAFDTIGNLFVGDRSGTIFKINPSREIFVFATLEPSVAAYHLAFSPTGELFVTGPDHVELRSRACASIRRARSARFIAASAVRRAWRLTARAICTSPRRSKAAAASCASLPTRAPRS